LSYDIGELLFNKPTSANSGSTTSGLAVDESLWADPFILPVMFGSLWWMVDIGAPYYIHQFRLFVPTSDC